MIHALEGYRWAEPNTVTSASCHICSAPCVITRGVIGPTCFASAIAKRATLHDRIRCPHSGREWHNRAVRLRRAIDDTPSKRVAALIQQDLETTLRDGLAETF
ncbi:MAG: hypothetical protein JNK05_30630 [Myxococcales bacterium]|nr:hypothetical protein [Myxococcales bacterium]